jgi:hypothetical protein
MGKAAVKVQARMRKFLYEGRISSMQESDSLRFPVDDYDVKTEDGWYDFAAETVPSSGSEGSNKPPPLDSAAPTGSASDCVVIEPLSTPAKPKVPDVQILDPAIASPVHIESRKRKMYELNRHFQDSWAAKCS